MLKFNYVDLKIQFEMPNHLAIKVFTRGFKKELAIIITKAKELKSNLTINDISSYITFFGPFCNGVSIQNFLSLKIQTVKAIDPFLHVVLASGRVAINE